MNSSLIASPKIREDLLRDPRYPVHQIADQLRPYLQVIVDQFHPEQIILFGSYAYGDPTQDSDVDLLVVKQIHRSSVADATSIRRAVRHLRHTVANLPLDILVRDPEDFRQRVEKNASFHAEIAMKGLGLV